MFYSRLSPCFLFVFLSFYILIFFWFCFIYGFAFSFPLSPFSSDCYFYAFVCSQSVFVGGLFAVCYGACESAERLLQEPLLQRSGESSPEMLLETQAKNTAHRSMFLSCQKTIIIMFLCIAELFSILHMYVDIHVCVYVCCCIGETVSKRFSANRPIAMEGSRL